MGRTIMKLSCVVYELYQIMIGTEERIANEKIAYVGDSFEHDYYPNSI